MASPLVPVEIQHHIISFVVNRPSALKCALVCRDWTSISRPVAFEKPVLVIKSQEKNSEDFIQLLTHPLSTFRESLLRVDIKVDETGVDYARLLCTVAIHGGHIKQLNLQSFPRFAPEEFIAFICGFLKRLASSQALERVELHGCRIDVISSLLRALSLSPGLRELALHPMMDGYAIASQPIPLPPPSLLLVETTWVDLDSEPFLKTWGMSSRCFSISVITTTQIYLLQNLAKSCQDRDGTHTLELRIAGLILDQRANLPSNQPLYALISHLHISHLHNWSPEMNFDLKSFTNLRSLIMSTQCPKWTILSEFTQTLFQSLSTIPNHRIPGFTLSLTLKIISSSPEGDTSLNHDPGVSLDEMIDDCAKSMAEAKMTLVKVTEHCSGVPRCQFTRCMARAKSEVSNNFSFANTHEYS